MTYKRKEVIGDCTLYLGDCLEVMPMLGKVDHLITDPPYEKEAHSKVRRTAKSVKSGGCHDVLDFAQITEELRDYVPMWANKNCLGWASFFCQVEAVSMWRDSIEKCSGKYKRACVWVKPDSSPQFNGEMPAQGYECFVLQWCGEGRSAWNSGGKRGVYTHLTNQSDRTKIKDINGQLINAHPTEKPLTLMNEMLNDFTNKDQTILDPFMGSGTTGVACVKLGRKFIGIELEEKYFDIACRRIQKAYDQPDIFIEAEKKKVEQAVFDV